MDMDKRVRATQAVAGMRRHKPAAVVRTQCRSGPCIGSVRDGLPQCKMYARKLTTSARERLRKQRKESQLIKARAEQRSFDYVVNPSKSTRIAFGSGQERVPFILQDEVRAAVAPQEHAPRATLGKDPACKLGSSSFASKVPRLQPNHRKEFPFQSIGVHVNIVDSFNQAARPFGFGAFPKQMAFLTPGPSAYALHAERLGPKLSSAFGTKRVLWPVVAVLCTPHNETKCCKCGHTPTGDYWHDVHAKLSMCRACMKGQRLHILKECAVNGIQRIHGNRELHRFVQTRHCSFYHDHNGTKAAVQTMPTKYLRFKIKKEAYLHLYA